MKGVMVFAALAIVLLGVAPASTLAKQAKPVAVEQLHAVGGSGVDGKVILRQLKGGGTAIQVIAKDLDPGTRYVSLYYDNDTCQLEDYEDEDFIGDPYTANRGGIGLTRGEADDDLDEIGSVSVRLASDFSLQACAKVTP